MDCKQSIDLVFVVHWQIFRLENINPDLDRLKNNQIKYYLPAVIQYWTQAVDFLDAIRINSDNSLYNWEIHLWWRDLFY